LEITDYQDSFDDMKLSDLNLLTDSGVPIVSVAAPIRERMKVLEQIYNQCAIKKKLPLYLWNVGWGYFKQVKYDFEQKLSFSNIESTSSLACDENVFTTFDFLLNCKQDGIFIFENLAFLISQTFSNKICSRLINIYYDLENSDKSKYLIILTTDDVELPQSLSSLIPTLSIELPNVEEVTDLIREVLSKFIGELPFDFDVSTFINAASGLTGEEIRLGLTIAVHSCQQLNLNSVVEHLLEYKINRFRSLNLNFVAKPSLHDFGGLDLLKKYIENVKQDFLPQARTVNIPLPKGCLLVGPPGTGKTLAAHISAKTLGFPLVSVDTAAVLAGDASDFKRLLKRVEACAPVVLYFDEFDKLFTASNDSGEDIGSRQILGTLLTWLQDKKSAVFA
jgi:ATPase family associated with various cellular activities (AAA)